MSKKSIGQTLIAKLARNPQRPAKQTFAEVSRAPKPSPKGSCRRKRAGQPQSAKVVRANALRELNSARESAKAVIRKAKAESHAAYVKAQEAKEQEAKIDAEDAATLESIGRTSAALSLNSGEVKS
jgi:hypothetical protein